MKPKQIRVSVWVIVFTIASTTLAAFAPVDKLKTSMPLRLIDDGAMIRVRVEGFNQPLFMLVDTGAAVSVLDPRFQSRLGTPVESAVIDTPINTDMPLKMYQGPQITLGQKVAPLGPVVCSDLRMARFITGEQCDGILGISFLTNFVVTLDFKNGLIELLHVPRGSPNSHSLPLFIQPDGRYSINAEIDRRPVSLLLDSGNSNAISLNQEDWAGIMTNVISDRNNLTATVGGQIANGRSRRVKSLVIGSTEYQNFVACEVPNPRLYASLGPAFFRQHRVEFDFPNGRVTLERQKFEEETWDMSGLHLLRISGKTIVYSIDPGSPGTIADMRENDVIVSLNGTVAESLRMVEIRDALRAGDAKEVVVEVQRNGERSHKTLHLKILR